MRRFLSLTAFLLLVTSTAACTSMLRSSVTGGEDAASSVASEEEIPLTREVTYEGTVETLPSPSGEATHRLATVEGTYLLLRSDLVNLDDYLGQRVLAAGTVRTTIDGTGELLRVTRVEQVLTDTASSSVSSEESVSSAATSSETQSSSFAPVRSSTPSLRSSSSPSSAPLAAENGNADSSSAGVVDLSTQTMAKTRGGDLSVWTQRYCSAHIGFCFPVHKNWWYKSFGTTASALWRVEVSDREIENMGDGPIAVTFESGPLPAGVSDGTVADADGKVIGYRAWTGNRHFEIAAPAALRSAVSVITANLATYDVPQP